MNQIVITIDSEGVVFDVRNIPPDTEVVFREFRSDGHEMVDLGDDPWTPGELVKLTVWRHDPRMMPLDFKPGLVSSEKE